MSTNHDDQNPVSTVSRRQMLGLAAGGTAALAAALLGPAKTAVAHGRGHGRSLTLEVAPDLSTFQFLDTGSGPGPFPQGPFQISGPIYSEDTILPDGSVPGGATAIGVFRCWGWIFDGSVFAATVNQTYTLDGHGQIHTQGHEGDLKRAVTGGTDAYKRAQGEAAITFINPANFTFRADFDLQ